MSKGTPKTTASDATILFVDDEPAILDIYELLCGPEYDVITAEDGRQALEAFGPHIDLAVIEREIPAVSGDDVVQVLRKEGYQTPVACVSAFDPDPDPAVEYDEYLTKPIENRQLRAVIERYTA